MGLREGCQPGLAGEQRKGLDCLRKLLLPILSPTRVPTAQYVPTVAPASVHTDDVVKSNAGPCVIILPQSRDNHETRFVDDHLSRGRFCIPDGDP